MRTFILATVAIAGCASNPYTPEFITAESAAAMTDRNLCIAWSESRHNTSHVVYDEIRRRDLLDGQELDAAGRGSAYIGMSEIALICAWGRPEHVNTANYGDGVQKQYQYCRGAYCSEPRFFYVEAGRVTAWN